MSIEHLVQAAAEQVAADNNATLADISALAEKQVEIEADIKSAEAYLKELKVKHNKVKAHDLPEAMMSVGITSFTLASGKIVKVDPFYSISIKKEFAAQALEWLEENGYGDIIKCTVETAFAKEEFDEAKQLADKLQDDGFMTVAHKGVHASTLKAWFKIHVELADTIPTEYFTYHVGQVTKLK